MTQAEIMSGIDKLLREEWPDHMPAEAIESSTPIFYDGLGLDSVDGVTLILCLEERFEIEIDKDDLSMKMLENVGTLAEFILRRVTRS